MLHDPCAIQTTRGLWTKLLWRGHRRCHRAVRTLHYLGRYRHWTGSGRLRRGVSDIRIRKRRRRGLQYWRRRRCDIHRRRLHPGLEKLAGHLLHGLLHWLLYRLRHCHLPAHRFLSRQFAVRIDVRRGGCRIPDNTRLGLHRRLRIQLRLNHGLWNRLLLKHGWLARHLLKRGLLARHLLKCGLRRPLRLHHGLRDRLLLNRGLLKRLLLNRRLLKLRLRVWRRLGRGLLARF